MSQDLEAASATGAAKEEARPAATLVDTDHGGQTAENADSGAKSLNPIEAAVSAWVDAHLRNSPFSRDTPAWNHLQASLPHLIAKIKEL